MKYAVLPARNLDDSVQAALEAASRLAQGWQQDYLGVEHLFLSILDGEEPDGPAHRLLAQLPISLPEVRKEVTRLGSVPVNRPVPRFVPLTPRCRIVLDRAGWIAAEHDCGETGTEHVMEAILLEGGSVAFHAISMNLGPLPASTTGSPAWMDDFRQAVETTSGAAWEFPFESETAIQRLLGITPGIWNKRSGPWVSLHYCFFQSLSVQIYPKAGKIRLRLSPDYRHRFFSQWLYRRALARRIAQASALPGAHSIPPATVFLKEWPEGAQLLGGRLNKSAFAARKPAGTLRPMEERDHAACSELYALLERTGQVPVGYAGEFQDWLRHKTNSRFVLEVDDHLAGCSGLAAGSVGEFGDSPLAGSLSFGLISPDDQGRGLGTTQIAARLLLLHESGCIDCRLWATEGSVHFMEHLGFAFWAIDRAKPGVPLYQGSVFVTTDDAAFLKGWLGWDETRVQELLPRAPGTETPP